MSKQGILQGVVGVGMVLLAALLTAHQPTTTRAAGPRDGPHNCYNVQLMIMPDKGGSGLGHIGLNYRIHNLWARPCTLRGFPGLELLDRNFHSLPTHPQRGNGYLIGNVPAHQVQLDSRHDAYFALEYSDNPVGHETCLHARYLMLIPPNDNLPDVTYSRIDPCGGKINVSPVGSRPTF